VVAVSSLGWWFGGLDDGGCPEKGRVAQ